MLGRLLHGAVPTTAGPVAVPPRESRLPALHDTCACHKGPVGYGREGWHLRRFGERDVEREIDRALAALPVGSSDEDRAAVERTTREWCAHYAGLPVAYERCPAYESAVRQSVVERRGKRLAAADDVLGSDL
jgi:hypothetical protein